MYIFFDFDHTVLDMSLMYQDILDGFEKLGVSKNSIDNIYKDATRWKLFNPELFAIKLEKELKIHQAESLTILHSFAEQSKYYLYNDVLSGLEALKEQGHNLHLISWGDQIWQEKKINACDLSDYFDETITLTMLKTDYLKTFYTKFSQIIFVDDKPAELEAISSIYPEINCIRMKRDGAKYSEEQTPTHFFEANKMQDIIHLIEQIS